MNVEELIEELQKTEDPDRIVCIGEPDGPGWANIDKLEIKGSCINLIPEKYPVFSDS